MNLQSKMKDQEGEILMVFQRLFNNVLEVKNKEQEFEKVYRKYLPKISFRFLK